MKEGLIKDTYELIIKEIQSLISVSYIILVGIGMLFTFHKYHAFGINIFNYANIFDFLIAPFSDYRIVMFTFLTALLSFLIYMFDLILSKRIPRVYGFLNMGINKKPWFSSYQKTIVIILFFCYLWLSALKYGNIVKENILNKENITITYADNETEHGKEIGKTNDMFFLLKNKKVKVIPLTALVKQIDLNEME